MEAWLVLVTDAEGGNPPVLQLMPERDKTCCGNYVVGNDTVAPSIMPLVKLASGPKFCFRVYGDKTGKWFLKVKSHGIIVNDEPNARAVDTRFQLNEGMRLTLSKNLVYRVTFKPPEEHLSDSGKVRFVETPPEKKLKGILRRQTPDGFKRPSRFIPQKNIYSPEMTEWSDACLPLKRPIQKEPTDGCKYADSPTTCAKINEKVQERKNKARLEKLCNENGAEGDAT